jgi:hypothetical protein
MFVSALNATRAREYLHKTALLINGKDLKFNTQTPSEKRERINAHDDGNRVERATHYHTRTREQHQHEQQDDETIFARFFFERRRSFSER